MRLIIIMAAFGFVLSLKHASFATPVPNTWTGSGPFATSEDNRVITALAVSADGQTIFSGNGSGTIFSYDYGCCHQRRRCWTGYQ
jgi:hypothetical protein